MLFSRTILSSTKLNSNSYITISGYFGGIVENLYNLVQKRRCRLGRNPINCILGHQHYYNFVFVVFCFIIVGDAANVIGYGHLGDASTRRKSS